MQLAGGRRPDAPEPLDRERVEELELAAGGHDQQAVRLGDPARNLGQELRAGDPDGDGQADLLAHIEPQLGRDLDRAAGDPLEPADVEEGLVDRERLDERGRVLEDAEDGLARLDVRIEPWSHDDCLGAERARLPTPHRGLDPRAFAS